MDLYSQEMITILAKACLVNKTPEEDIPSMTVQIKLFGKMFRLYRDKCLSGIATLGKRYLKYYSTITECQSILGKIEAYTSKRDTKISALELVK